MKALKDEKIGRLIFKLNHVSNKIIKSIAEEKKIQIILDIDRALTSDSYKVIFLILEHCYKALEFKITNKKHLEGLNLEEPKWYINKAIRFMQESKTHFFEYRYN